VLSASRQTVARPHDHDIESASAGILHHLIQGGTTSLHPAYPVIRVRLHNLQPSLHRELAKVEQLRLWMLVYRGNADVYCGSFCFQGSTLKLESIPDRCSAFSTL
jgi:hypothetical protein